MPKVEKMPVEQMMSIVFWMTLAVLLSVGAIAWNNAGQSVAAVIGVSIVLLITFLALLHERIRREMLCKRCGSLC